MVMSDGNLGNQEGISGLNLHSEFRILRYIYGHKMEYVSLMGKYRLYIYGAHYSEGTEN